MLRDHGCVTLIVIVEHVRLLVLVRGHQMLVLLLFLLEFGAGRALLLLSSERGLCLEPYLITLVDGGIKGQIGAVHEEFEWQHSTIHSINESLGPESHL